MPSRPAPRAFTLIELPKAVSKGFTLIELLVVITIIVVLLALLTPALEKAVYQAQLATCAARLKGIGAGATTYAVGNNRSYPHRGENYMAKTLYNATTGYDLRPIIKDYIPLTLMLDPFTPVIDLSREPIAGAWIMGCYNLYFGFGFTKQQGMTRLGDGWGWNGRSYQLIAGDRDRIVRGGDYLTASHPDSLGILYIYTEDIYKLGSGYHLTRWQVSGRSDRGTMEMNFAYVDGSVQRFNTVNYNDPLIPDSQDERMARVPNFWNAYAWDEEWYNVPRE